jgi:Na+/H+-dicarboxylate symporter
MSESAMEQIAATAEISVATYFSITLEPLLDTLSAVVLAFILGLCLSIMRGKKQIGNSLYNGIGEFSSIIDTVLHSVIIPLLPLYICGTFVDMTKSGKTFAILSILWKVFLVVIAMHLIYIFLQFLLAGVVSKKNAFTLVKNQIPGYMTAVGTQSSAATIPVNLECAKADGVSEEIRNFVVPLCANIHMCGSMITITACATAVCLMNQLPISLGTVVPFIMTLGVAMVASPGAPGGSIMTALPFLYMIFGTEAGDPNGPICAIMVALYITQDSFGTACNVSGDNAIGVIMNTIYEKWIKQDNGAKVSAAEIA